MKNHKLNPLPFLWLLFVFTLPLPSFAANYTLPDDIGNGPFSDCSGSGPSYTCSSELEFENTANITLNETVTLIISSGEFKAEERFTVIDNGYSLNLDVQNGDVKFEDETTFNGNIHSGNGDIKFEDETTFTGDIHTDNGNIQIEDDSSHFTGDISTDNGNIEVEDGTIVDGVCAPDDSKDNNSCTGISAGVDLEINKSRSGSLIPGETASYTLTVSNIGNQTEPGSITVIDTLPSELSYVSFSGSNWSCNASGQDITCTHGNSLAATATATPLVININVSSSASGSITNTATVSGTGSDSDTSNNTTTDSFTITSGCNTLRDEFSTEAYNRNDGTINWTGNWIETGDNGSVSNGDIEINNSQLQLEGDGSGGSATFAGPSIEREADLSAYTSATLSFNYYETGNWEGDDTIDIWVSSDGGANWTKIHFFNNDQGSSLQTFSYDITAYIANNFRLAFVERASSSSEIFYIDDVQIEVCGGTASNICQENFRDDFNNASFSENNGSVNFSGVWQEYDSKSSGASSGYVRIAGGQLSINNYSPEVSSSPGVIRSLDLTGFTSANLLFDFSTTGGVDNDDRFEIHISDNGGTNWTLLEEITNINNGIYSRNYDISNYISSNTQISLRISDQINNGSCCYGSSGENIHFDFIEVSASKNCSSVDHYTISYPLGNPGITCEANAVTITAHDASDVTMVPASGTQITLSTSLANDGWSLKSGDGAFTSPNQYTFDGLESSVQFWLRKTSATSNPHIDIDVTDGTATDNDGDAAEDANAEFTDTGMRFFDASTGATEAINHQIAGKPSSTAPNHQTLQLRAIKTNSTTQACEAALQGTTAIELAYECNDPGTCTGSDLLTVSAAESKTIARNNNGSVTNYNSVNMSFDGNGVAPFSFYYNDAGKIQLHARKVLSADNSKTPPTAATTLSGTSNQFVVRPFGFYMANLTTATDAADANVFAKAGNDFISSLTAKIWVSGEDTDNNGIPDDHDDLSNNLTTLNFGNEISAQSIVFSQSKVLPVGAGTSSGSLGGDTTRTAGGGSSHFSSGIASNISLNWNEVGIIDLIATLGNYINSGQAISSSKTNVGRFIPHHFAITDNTPDFSDSCNSFTYLDQPFYYGNAPVLTVTAKAKSGSTTQNYGGSSIGANGFWKLSSSLDRSFLDGHLSAPSAILSVTSAGSVSLSNENDFDGIGTLSQVSGTGGDQFYYNKNTLEIPFIADVDITYSAATLTDADGVCYDPDTDLSCDSYAITIADSTSVSTELRYGRMALFDAYGSELNPLKLPLSLEYWDDIGSGNTTFIVSSSDTCTSLNASDIIFSDFNGNLSSGETSVSAISLSSGNGYITLSAPGNNNGGSVCVEYDLTGSSSGNDQFWLQESWNCASKSANNPLGHARFGIFPGNSRQIYMREQY